MCVWEREGWVHVNVCLHTLVHQGNKIWEDMRKTEREESQETVKQVRQIDMQNHVMKKEWNWDEG